MKDIVGNVSDTSLFSQFLQKLQDGLVWMPRFSTVRLDIKVPSVDDSAMIPLSTKIYRDPKQHKCEGKFP